MPSPSYRIAIAGCGIAGLSVALFLKRAGHEPLIFDKMQSPKPIGSGLMLQPTGLAVLEQLRLSGAVHDYGQRIDNLLGKAGGRAILDVRYDALGGEPYGLAVHRAALFDVLYQAVLDEDIIINTNCDVSRAEDGTLYFENQPPAIGHDFIIDALGVTSPLKPERTKPLPYGALWATLDWNPGDGFDPHCLTQRYEAARKMVGVLPVGTIPGVPGEKLTFFWSLKHEDYADWQTAGLDVWKNEALALWPETAPLLEQITSPDQLTLARYAHQTVSPPYRKRLVHIGDAYHCASPQLGQGANMALLDAHALAAALETQPTPDRAFQAFRKSRRHHVRLYQFMARAFTPVYQSDSRLIPWLRDYLVPPIARIWPFPKLLALIVSGLVGGPLKHLDGQSRKV